MSATLATNADQQTLAARVREERERCGMTMLQLAEALSVDESTISRWESADRAIDSVALRRISEVLGVPMETFFRSAVDTVAHRQGDADSEAMNEMLTWAQSFLTDVEFVRREATRHRD